VPRQDAAVTTRSALAPRTAVPSALLVVGVLVVAANLRASITVVGPLISDIRADLGLSDAMAGVLVAIPLLAFAVVSPVAPAIARRFGVERSLAGALLVLAVALVVRSLPFAAALWGGTMLLGAAIAVLNVVLPALVKRDHTAHVGRITGFYSAVQSGVAAVAAGLAVPIASATAAGWRLALGVWALLALVGWVVLAAVYRGREPHRPVVVVNPRPARSPWTTAVGWQVTLFMGLQSVSFFVLVTWWPSVERSAGVPAATAGWHLSVFQALGVVGSLSCGAVLRRGGHERSAASVAALLILAGILGQLAEPTASLLWIVLTGLGCGASIVLALSLFGIRARDTAEAAALSGMGQSIGYLLAAAGPPLFGVLHDGSGGWVLPLLGLAVVVVLQLVAGVVAGRTPSTS
jgi:CP family cyanate transporter-like MFS transporter